MKKYFLSLALASSLTLGYELQYVADTQFCLRASQPLQVCTFAQDFYNFADFASRLKDEDRKDKKAKAKKYIDRMCFSWDLVPPMGRDFLLKNVTYNGAPILDPEDMFNICNKSKK